MAVLVGNGAGTAFEGSPNPGMLLQPACAVVVLVSVEIRSVFKAFPALWTLIGSLSCVDALVAG